jgi:hypothetical protein
MRYVRAFFTALRMTLRGETYTPAPPSPLLAWIDEAARVLNVCLAAADQQGFDQAAREGLTLVIDRRTISAQTILMGVRYHLTKEYAYLNLNDQYALERLSQHEALPPRLKTPLEQLITTLKAIPHLS